MSAEEMVNPQKDISKGFLSGMGILMVMAFLTLFLTAGIAPTAVVDSADFPLPLALGYVFGENSIVVKLMGVIGLFGLVASLHGIILSYSRQSYALARAGILA